jgi:endoglucanase
MSPLLHRRTLLPLLAAPWLAGAAPPPAGLDPGEWQAFCGRFLRPDGRVVDTFNGGISHSEGQGWALLCAESAEDRAGFDLVLGWTRRALARRGDALFAWRWRPDGGGMVDDPNNATDGDLMIAWALLRAGQRWREPDYTAQGIAVARDVLRLLVRQVGDETVLLPGATGFEQREHVVLNPSYYAFPALRALAQAVPDPLWLRLAADGLGLLRRARFGRWGLPPDWVALPRSGGRPAPAPGWPARFSYDAVRVPLYLAWAGLGREPAVASAVRFWSDPQHVRLPAWTDLGSDGISPYAAPAGMRAILLLAVAGQAARPSPLPALPAVSEAKDYYSAVLTLLVRLAWRDSLAPAILI